MGLKDAPLRSLYPDELPPPAPVGFLPPHSPQIPTPDLGVKDAPLRSLYPDELPPPAPVGFLPPHSPQIPIIDLGVKDAPLRSLYSDELPPPAPVLGTLSLHQLKRVQAVVFFCAGAWPFDPARLEASVTPGILQPRSP